MKVRLIGDVHGKFKRYRTVLKYCDRSLQVGDMGVGFRRMTQYGIQALANPPHRAMSKGEHYFIHGNHDNYDVCKRHPFFVDSGSLAFDKIFVVGGALSTDRVYRTENFDWWANEEHSLQELDALVDRYNELKPEIVVTHDCPESIARDLMACYRPEKMEYASRTRQAFQSMLHFHKPKQWYFGHWHHNVMLDKHDTHFRCIAELDYVDIEI